MAQADLKSSAQSSRPDTTLLLARLEKEILCGGNLETCRRVLGREKLWRGLGEEKQLVWARLAQAAGDTETALAVLAYVNSSVPGLVEAWEARLELLNLLERREEAIRVLALAKAHIEDEKHRTLGAVFATRGAASDDKAFHAAAGPFERLRREQQAFVRYLELFSGREDCFARQWADKGEGKQGYVPVRRPMTSADLGEHLSGRRTYGIYLLGSDATVRTAVIDVDLKDRFRGKGLKAEEKSLVRREALYLISRLKEVSGEAGLKPLTEFSGGKGFHLWYFFDPVVPAGTAKRCLECIAAQLKGDLTAFQLEVFPLQERLGGKGLGNLVKLPLGVHRLSGKRSYFIDCRDRSTEAQLAYLAEVCMAGPEALESVGKAAEKDKVVVHPRWRQWAESFPELSKLERLCPPLGQIVATCREGRPLSMREEKVFFQTVGFLPGAGKAVHHLMGRLPDYNPHLVDFKLSRLRGTPLGCRRVHSLLGFEGDMCPLDLDGNAEYAHPLLHLGLDACAPLSKAEKAENLGSALENLKHAITLVQRFVK